MKAYDIHWQSQSTGAADSMPFGGFDTGCNVWVEDDAVFLYVSQCGAFDENGTLLKTARLRLWLEDDRTLLARSFHQQLHLEDGIVTMDAGEPGNQVHFRFWAAVTKSEIHVAYRADRPHRLRVALENWRDRPRMVAPAERHQCRDYDFGYPGEVVTRADVVEPADGLLLFHHRNEGETVWNAVIAQQRLEAVADRIPNPLRNRTMGGRLALPGMRFLQTIGDTYAGTDFTGYLYGADGGTNQEIVLTLHTACSDTVAAWMAEVAVKAALPVSEEETTAWWRSYFRQSWIRLDPDNPDTEAFRIGRNYQLFRHMLGCNAYGEYPTKFNGGLFTFDAGPTNDGVARTPDFRQWSGIGFTAQNQRLLYWPMLKAGDFDAMQPQLDFYRNLTEAAKARVSHHFGLPGAFFFEQGNLFGLCTGAEYGWHHSPEIAVGFEDNPWVRLHLSGGLEFAQMMLEFCRYQGEPVAPFLSCIESMLDFYFAYYPLDADGKLRIFPSSALETFKGADPHSKDDRVYGCDNPMDAIAGLRGVLSSLLERLEAEQRPEQAALREKCGNRLAQCPALPCGTDADGCPVFLPAERYAPKPFNSELPELYRIFPYSTLGLSEEEREVGRNTYRQPYADPDMYLGCSWHQNGIFAARLGLLEEAWKYLRIKLDDAPRRYPAFWGPGHDWTPDHNHGGSGMIGLQEMLMQCDGREIRLFPCWDRSADASIRRHAPDRTQVTCVLAKGVITELTVSPEERRGDVVLPAGWQA